MNLLTLFSMLAFVSARNVSTVNSFTYKSCGDSNDICKNLALNTDPPVPQTDYTLFLNCDLDQEVSGGTSKYDFSLNGIPFSPSTNDLCTEISNSNTTCPLTVGEYYSMSNGSVPTGVSGKIIIKNQWYDKVGSRILCMEYTIRIS